MAYTKEKKLEIERKKEQEKVISRKKKLIKNELFNHTIGFDPVQITIMRFHHLDFIIEKINFNTPRTKDIDVENGIYFKKYIELMEHFLDKFRDYFFEVRYTEYMVRHIIISNPERIEEYLRIKDPVGVFHKNEDADLKVYQLIISNFISNAKYIPYIKTLLEENRLYLKSVDEYDYDECCKIVNLLSDIAFCQCNRGSIDCLFINIDYDIESSINLKKNRNRRYKEEQGVKLQNKILSDNIKGYNTLFEIYNNKKPYLKYFRVK